MAKFEEFVKSGESNTDSWSGSPKVRLTGEDLDALEKIFAARAPNGSI